MPAAPLVEAWEPSQRPALRHTSQMRSRRGGPVPPATSPSSRRVSVSTRIVHGEDTGGLYVVMPLRGVRMETYDYSPH